VKGRATPSAGPKGAKSRYPANAPPSGVSPARKRVCGKRDSSHVRHANPRQMPAPAEAPREMGPPTLEAALDAARQEHGAARAAFKGNRPYPTHGTEAQKAEWRAVLRRSVRAYDEVRRLQVLLARDCMSELDKQYVDRLARALVVLKLMVNDAAKGLELNEDAQPWLQAAEEAADGLLREFAIVTDISIAGYQRHHHNLNTPDGLEYAGMCLDGIEATVQRTQPQNDWAKDVAVVLSEAVRDFRGFLQALSSAAV